MGASKPRPGRPPLPIEGQRQRLLDAARQLLAQRELEAAGVRELVAIAGMSSRAFYQVFDSKDALILDLARGLGDRFLAQLAAVPDPSETLDTKQVTTRLMDAFVDVGAPLIALDGARLPPSTADALQDIRSEVLDASLGHMFERFGRALRAERITALPDRTHYEIVVRGILSLTADLSRQGRLRELEGLKASIGRLLIAQVPLAARPKRK